MTTTNPKQHIHHDMIVEWAKNPNRKLQYRPKNGTGEWYDLCAAPIWSISLDYRFKPEIVTVTYRKALMKSFTMKGYFILNIHGESIYQKAPEAVSRFIKWLGDPITETIEI